MADELPELYDIEWLRGQYLRVVASADALAAAVTEWDACQCVEDVCGHAEAIFDANTAYRAARRPA